MTITDLFVSLLAGFVGGTVAVILFAVTWARDGRVPRSTSQGAAEHHGDPDRLLKALRANTPPRERPLPMQPFRKS